MAHSSSISNRFIPLRLHSMFLGKKIGACWLPFLVLYNNKNYILPISLKVRLQDVPSSLNRWQRCAGNLKWNS